MLSTRLSSVAPGLTAWILPLSWYLSPSLCSLGPQHGSLTLPLLFLQVYCRGPLVELLISSDVGRYLEYKALERVYTEEADGTFLKVPFSKEDVFLSSSVSVVDKRRLMKFLTFCLEHEAHPEQYQDQQDLPFSQYLAQKQITGYLSSVIRFAIALDQRGDVSTLSGLRQVKEHLLSLRRYGNTAFLWPMYGISETSQAFCRLTAIFGGIYMLRCHPRKFLLAQELDAPAPRISHVAVSEEQAVESRFVVCNLDHLPSTAYPTQFSRATLIVDRPVHRDTLVDLTVIPPGRFGNPHPVYVVHTDARAGSSPEDRSVIYLSTVSSASTGATARADLQAVVDGLFATAKPSDITSAPGNSDQPTAPIPTSTAEGSETSPGSASAIESPVTDPAANETAKPILFYALFYNQRSRVLDWNATPENLFVIPDAAGSIVSEDSVRVAREAFLRMFPGEEFLPATPRPEEALSVEAILAQEAPQGTGFEATPADE